MTARVKPRTKAQERVLAYCNRVRGERGLRPVKTFCPGIPGSPNSCAVARTIGDGAIVDTYLIFSDPFAGERKREMPLYVTKFVDRFDGGRFPDLEADDAVC